MSQAPRSIGQQQHPPRADRVNQFSGFLALAAALLVAVSAIAGCAESSVTGSRARSTPPVTANSNSPCHHSGPADTARAWIDPFSPPRQPV